MIYRATVVDNRDPDKHLAVRVSCPTLFGERISGWVQACVPMAGSTVPPIGEHLWITLEAGDVAKPIWIGRWLQPGQLS